MKDETKNDIYDLLDLLNKLYSLSFLSDKDRLNEVRNEIMSTMTKSNNLMEQNVSEADESLYSMENIVNILDAMKKIRRKDKMIDFLMELDIKPYDKKLSLDDMRGRAIVELIERGLSRNDEKTLKTNSKNKSSAKTDKKDFMDMWLDFYKQNKASKTK